MYLSIFFVMLIGFIGSSQQDPICGENEHYTCSSTCVSTCQNFQFANCDPQCERGCYCKPNYIRSEDGGKCIPVRDCWKKFRN